MRPQAYRMRSASVHLLPTSTALKVVRGSNPRPGKMLEPDLLNTARVALEKVEEVNIAFRTEETFPGVSPKHYRKAAPIPILRNRSRRLLGRLNERFHILSANARLVGRRNHDVVR